jgi:hypothetical protein
MLNNNKLSLLEKARSRNLSIDELRSLIEDISDPWLEAQGLLKKKKVPNPVKYQKSIRKSWSK